jgi:homoserine O-acetyltransferase
MARTARWSQLVNEAARRALFLDAACTRPRPAGDAWRMWTPVAQAIVARSPDAMSAFATQSDMLHWLDERAAWHAAHGPDPFDWAWQSFAYDAHDVGSTPGFAGDLPAALRSIVAETLVLAPPLDLYNPVADARLAASLAGARFLEIPSRAGHQAASGVERADTALLQRTIGEFLAS